MEYFLLLIGQSVILYFISRKTTTLFFYFLRRISHHEKFNFSLIAILYLPGTIIHEMSHFFAALVLFLKVRDVSIFPSFQKNYIKLGSVTYERKDFIRGFLVGIAPLGGGMMVLYGIGSFHLFPSPHFLLNALMIYFIFTVSSTMFSSSQDLVDFLYMIPFLVIGVGLTYLFYRYPHFIGIDITQVIENATDISQLVSFMKTINLYLLFSLIINISVITFMTIITHVLKNEKPYSSKNHYQW